MILKHPAKLALLPDQRRAKVMLVYHGGSAPIKEIDLQKCRQRLIKQGLCTKNQRVS